ncbi:MAG TPA: hypothetical protein VN554_02320 [Verrucomicrobiae bacterium]|nr:hypothetical protein [Verrucomicrobiae bacterium]
MTWDDVHDPKDEIDFHMEWTLVSSSYTPEEIQELINNEGVEGMVHIVNQHFKLSRHGKPVLQLGYVGDRKAVVQY